MSFSIFAFYIRRRSFDALRSSIVQTIKINGLVIKEKVRYFDDEVRFACKLKQLAMLDYSHRTPVYVPARATRVHCTFIYRVIHKYRVSRCNETVRHDSVDRLFRFGQYRIHDNTQLTD